MPRELRSAATPDVVRRKLLKSLPLGAALMAAGVGDAWLFEPQHLVVKRVDVRLDGLAGAWDGLRIVQLSDFHYVDRSDGRLIRRAVDLANSLNPDLIALTGDYVTSGSYYDHSAARNALPCAEILSDLRAPLGVFATLGNHDLCNPRFITRALEAQGVPVLRNSAVYVERAGARLWIAGVEDVIDGHARLDQALQFVPESGTTILLAHEPDFADVAKKYPVALQLSGHSHGGQVRLPIIDSLFFPKLGRKYPAGMYRVGEMALYTNSGLGTVFLPVRFNCPPEVTLLTLRVGSGPAGTGEDTRA